MRTLVGGGRRRRHFCFPEANGLDSVRAVSSNPVYSFFATPGNPGPFLLRMAMATTFFYHGMQKAFGWFGGEGWIATIDAWTAADGLGIPYVVVAAIIVLELALALGLFLGFLTRLNGLAVAILMIGAIIYIHSHDGTTFEKIEYPILFVSAGLALVFTGGGALSIDRGISSNLLPSVG